MSRFMVEVPDAALAAIGSDEDSAADEIKLAAAMQFYAQGRLSAGAASELAGVSVPEFLTRVQDFNVPPYELTRAELEAEMLND